MQIFPSIIPNLIVDGSIIEIKLGSVPAKLDHRAAASLSGC